MFLTICAATMFILTGFEHNINRTQPKSELPEAWVGTWKGNLKIHSNGNTQEVPMTLKIARKEKSYDWVTTYEATGKIPRMTKDYRLVPGEDGQFNMDEQNGIVLKTYWQNQTLWCAFELKGTQFVSRWKLEGEELTFELLTLQNNGKDSGPVRLLDISNLQTARMKKAKQD